MKLTHLKSLTAAVLEEIKHIETSLLPPSVASSESLENQNIRQFAKEARQICQRWSDESKLTFPNDVLPVIEFFLTVIAELIKEQAISETCFNRQKSLLDLTDRILMCRQNTVDFPFIQARLTYYKTLMYFTQKDKEVGTICTYLQECMTFSCDQPAEQCMQIHILNTLCVACVTWMNGSERELKAQDKVSLLTSQLVIKMMDIYDEIPFSSTIPGWDPASLYSNLVVRALGSALRHFLEIYRNPPKASDYRRRVETLMTRLQTFMGRHALLTPPEKEYRLVFTMIIDFLKVLGTADSWLRELMIQIAENLARQIGESSDVLAYQAAIAAMRKPVMEKLSDQKMKPLPLAEENAKLQQQLREIQHTSKKQQREWQEKNNLLQQRLKKGLEEKSDFDFALQSKDAQIQHLSQHNIQLKTQLKQVKNQEKTLQQQHHQLSAELRQITPMQERQTAQYKQQKLQWTQRLREQQLALHSVSTEKRRLETEVTSSQSTVRQLEEKLKHTHAQLTEAQEQIKRHTQDQAHDRTEAYQQAQALQGEINRLRALLSLQNPSLQGGDCRFQFYSR